MQYGTQVMEDSPVPSVPSVDCPTAHYLRSMLASAVAYEMPLLLPTVWMVMQALVRHGMQVLEDAPASPSVIVADCPTAHHLPSLLASTAWVPFARQAGSSPAQHANCIVHLAPAEVSYVHKAACPVHTNPDAKQCVASSSACSMPIVLCTWHQAELSAVHKAACRVFKRR